MSIWNLLARPLGIKGIDVAGVERASLAVTIGAVVLALLIAVAIGGIVIGILTYAKTTEPIAGRKRAYFAISRMLVYTLLALGLSGLVLDADLEIAHKRRTVVLVDNTQSMVVRAPVSAGKEAGAPRRIDLVRRMLSGPSLTALGKKRSVQVQTLGGAEIAATKLDQVQASGERTDIPAAVVALAREQGALELDEIVLITDGRNSVRADYGTATAILQERGIKLYPVIVGDVPNFKDVRLTAASTTPYCRAFDRLAVSFAVHSHRCSGERVKVEICEAEAPDKVLASTELTLADKPTGQRGYLTLAPPGKAGDLRLRVRVGQVAGEVVSENNERDLFTRVVDEPIKVLYVDNFPRAELKHVKWSLDRDPNIALTLLNRMPGGSWLVQGPNLLEKPELGFPAETVELVKFDVLILGSISRGYFSAGDRFEERKLTNIARFVSGRGGGLIVLGGHRSYGHGKYYGSPLDPLLPFEVYKPGEEDYLTEEVRAELLPLSRSHPVVQLASTVEENAKLWGELPELMGCNVVGKARPGAEVLAVASKEVDGRKPILFACQQYGFGRVFACTTYSMFRWRLGTPVERGDVLGRFWGQVVRYIAPDPRIVAQALNIQRDKPYYVRGETARLLLRPLDRYYGALRNRQVRLTVQRPDRTTTEVLLNEDPSTKGFYPAEVLLDQAGAYEITATCGAGLKEHVTLVAGVSSEEFLDPRSSGEQLSQVALASGGKLFSIEQAGDLVKELPSEPKVTVQRLEAPLWDCPLLLLLILGLCLAEWFFRKRSGLA